VTIAPLAVHVLTNAQLRQFLLAIFTKSIQKYAPIVELAPMFAQ